MQGLSILVMISSQSNRSNAFGTIIRIIEAMEPAVSNSLFTSSLSTVNRISGKIQTLFSGSLKYIAADFTHLFNSLIAVTMNCLRLPETVSLQQELIEPGDLHNLPNLFTDTCHLEPAFILQRLIHHKKDTKASR